ncbi:GIY-YIG nuclease family protein [Candidatus Gottesmanbacteria bacterium]|nr:GIY-YIG nuclease family protein [Candidatus Gottesmanbacteria bacterium]
MWHLYVAICNDGTLYTGIATNLIRRETEHNTDDKRGARSLRGKRPVKIVYSEVYQTQNEARKREAEIKGWKRKYKLKLIEKA